MVGRAAAALHMPKPEEQQAVIRRKALRRRPKKRLELITAYGLFVATAVGLVLLYVAQYAYVSKLNLQLSRRQNILAQIESTNQQLESEAASLQSLRRIENEAVGRLGMQKPQVVRTVKASVVTSDPEGVAQADSVPLETELGNDKTDRLLAFRNWTRNLRKALAKEIAEYH